jgi:hypothetical protein
MDRGRVPRIVGSQQDRRQECAAGDRRLGIRIARHNPCTGGFELGNPGANVVALADTHQCPHARVFGARIADLSLRQPFGERPLDRVEIFGRGHGSADGRALLARLDRHLRRDFLDE